MGGTSFVCSEASGDIGSRGGGHWFPGPGSPWWLRLQQPPGSWLPVLGTPRLSGRWGVLRGTCRGHQRGWGTRDPIPVLAPTSPLASVSSTRSSSGPGGGEREAAEPGLHRAVVSSRPSASWECRTWSTWGKWTLLPGRPHPSVSQSRALATLQGACHPETCPSPSRASQLGQCAHTPLSALSGGWSPEPTLPSDEPAVPGVPAGARP